MKYGLKRVEPPTEEKKTHVIDSEEYREGTYKKLNNGYPLGASFFEKEREEVTEYLWYNGSTTFVNGEKFKR